MCIRDRCRFDIPHTINTINSNSWHPLGFIPLKLSRKQNFAKRICLQWTSSNKVLITFENLCISRLRCMSKVPVLQSWFKLLTLTKTARRLGISEACPRERDRTVLVLKALLPRPRRRRGRQRPRRPRRRPQPQPARMTHGGRQSWSCPVLREALSGPESTPSTLRTK